MSFRMVELTTFDHVFKHVPELSCFQSGNLLVTIDIGILTPVLMVW